MASGKARPDPVAEWNVFVQRTEQRAAAGDREGAARNARHLDNLPSNHPGLKGVSPAQRSDWSRRLHAASKGN